MVSSKKVVFRWKNIKLVLAHDVNILWGHVCPPHLFFPYLSWHWSVLRDRSIHPPQLSSSWKHHPYVDARLLTAFDGTYVLVLFQHTCARAQPWCTPKTCASQCELPRYCHSLLSVAVGLIFNDLVQPRAGVHHLLCVIRILVLHPSFGHGAEMTFYWSAWWCLHLTTSIWCSKSLW